MKGQNVHFGVCYASIWQIRVTLLRNRFAHYNATSPKPYSNQYPNTINFAYNNKVLSQYSVVAI